ncbi:mucin-16 [Malaclemys terrapin pileata]|uniref:mucin-16 n=1 Tax=Malaclemys terrapin pileata TaxID=2991368 RepID=UPI0023A899DD|nr:mucin-16 [Malaclemys terrapin pileata]
MSGRTSVPTTFAPLTATTEGSPGTVAQSTVEKSSPTTSTLAETSTSQGTSGTAEMPTASRATSSPSETSTIPANTTVAKTTPNFFPSSATSESTETAESTTEKATPPSQTTSVAETSSQAEITTSESLTSRDTITTVPLSSNPSLTASPRETFTSAESTTAAPHTSTPGGTTTGEDTTRIAETSTIPVHPTTSSESTKVSASKSTSMTDSSQTTSQTDRETTTVSPAIPSGRSTEMSGRTSVPTTFAPLTATTEGSPGTVAQRTIVAVTNDFRTELGNSPTSVPQTPSSGTGSITSPAEKTGSSSVTSTVAELSTTIGTHAAEELITSSSVTSPPETTTVTLMTTSPTETTPVISTSTMEGTTTLPLLSTSQPETTAAATSTIGITSTSPLETSSAAETTAMTSSTGKTTIPTERTTITSTTGAEVTSTPSVPSTSQAESTAVATSTALETTTVLEQTTSPAESTTIISTSTIEGTTTLPLLSTSQPETTATTTSTIGITSTSPLETSSAAETTAMTIPASTAAATSTAPETTTVTLMTTSPTETTPVIITSTMEGTTTLPLLSTSQPETTASVTSTIGITSTSPLETSSAAESTAITSSTRSEESTTLPLLTTSGPGSTAIATSTFPETSTTLAETTIPTERTTITRITSTSPLETSSAAETTAMTSSTRKTTTVLEQTTSPAESTPIISTSTMEGTTTLPLLSTSQPETTAAATSTRGITSTSPLETSSAAETTAMTIPASTAAATSTAPETTTVTLMTTSPTETTPRISTSTMEGTTTLPLLKTTTVLEQSTSPAESTPIISTSTMEGTTTLPLLSTSQPETTAAATSTRGITSTSPLETSSAAETTAMTKTTIPTERTTITSTTGAEVTSTPSVPATSQAESTARRNNSSHLCDDHNVAFTYHSCIDKPVRAGNDTGVDAVCTYRRDSTAPPFDRVGVYHEIRNKTNGITKLGPYTLDKDSLYVNGYNEAPALPTIEHFTVNFTITNFKYDSQLGSPHYARFNATEKALISLLDPIFGNSSIGPDYIRCEVTAYRPVRAGNDTGVDAICTYRRDSTAPPFDRVGVYHEIRNTTNGITKLGPYTLDKDSLYVNGYNEAPALPTVLPVSTPAPAIEHFTVNFTITNFKYDSQLGSPHSARFNATEKALISLLDPIFGNSSIGPDYIRCQVTAYRPVRAGNDTGVDAVCTYRRDSTAPPFDRVGVYHEIRNKTIGITKLGPYTLDKDSLYVNGYNEAPALPTVLPVSTPAPAIEHFTVNFTITNFKYDSQLGSPHSALFNATEKALISLLDPIFGNSSIGPDYIRCEVTAYRPVRAGNDTGVDAVCTYRHDSTAPPFDRVGVYHEIRNTTNGITKLGPYTLDKDSLYVNGYNEAPTLPTVLPISTPVPAIEHFTVNFTITNFKYDSQLGSPHSARFNATEKALISLLNPIFGNSSIGPDYIRCEVTAYRPVRAGNDTGVDAVCTYRRDSTAPPFDRVGVYHEIRNKTNGITKLGPYTLDKDSLYVNGYNEAPALPTVLPISTPAPAIEHFTVNFTITNFKYDSQLGSPHSARFNATEKALISLLDPIFGNSSIGPDYIRCEVTAYRPVRAGNDTGVDAVCTYRRDSTAPPFDRVGVYHEIRNTTNGITKLGPYTLDKDSLYVNGYNEAPTLPTIEPFTVNFTITNFKYDSQLGSPHYARFNATEKALISLLDPIFGNSSIGPDYIRCEVTAYRPVRAGNDTGVDAICTYRRDSTAPPFDRVGVYHEIRNTTNGITKLGPYTLDKDSLYVNGYNEAPALPTVLPVSTPAPAIEHFTVNFTITNFKYDSQLGSPHSARFNATEKALISLLDPIFGNSSIGPDYIRCQVTAYRPVRAGNDTGVDAVCTYRRDSTAPPFDRVGVYHEIRNKTIGITKLGPYTLDKDSLYVNGYNEAPALPTIEPFTVNFTITNFKYDSQLGSPHYARFNATEKALISLLDPIFGNSSIGPDYIRCEVTAYRPVRAGNDTGVDAICTYRRDSTAPPFDRVGVYHEIRNTTNGITKLGPYTLDKDSLYVNGYNEAPALPTVLPVSTPAPAIEHFTVNFTITNFKYDSQLGSPHSARFNATEKALISLLDPIFGNSSIGPDYIRCQVTAYRPVRAGNDTGVDAVCTYRRDSTAPPFDRVGVYHEIRNKTIGITKLGPYTLDKDSLYVNGYNEAPALPTIEHFTVNFTITNFKYDSQLGSPHSALFNATEKALISLLNPIFGNSSIGPDYIRCEVTAYRPVRAGNDTGVDAVCTYRRDSTAPPFDRVGVYHEIRNKTNGITKLGPYTLDKDSLYVNGYNEAPALPTVLPISTPVPAIEHFTVNFTITNFKYDSQLGSPHSARFNATEKALISLLNPIFGNSSIGPDYIRCEVTAYRPVRAGNDTGVDAVCTYRRDSTAPPFDRVGVYHEIRNKTNGITKLGPYTLDKDSLYVNGYNEAPALPTVLPISTPAPAIEHFTVNFTITNFKYDSQLGSPQSARFNATEKALISLLNPIFGNSSIGPDYIRCEVTAYRPVRAGNDTGVDAVCTYRRDSTAPPFDRVGVYHEIRNKTNGITKLGPYTLDKDSLYVNGYNEAPALPTVLPISTPAPAIEHFTVNFTITNFKYDAQLGSPHSARFKATEKALISLLNPIFGSSSIGPDYIRCEVTAYSPVENGDGTHVDALCTYRNDSTRPKFDRAKVYHELSNKTGDITKLGPYNLDNSSLYVNEYNEALLGPTLSPTTPQSPTAGHFTLNFTLTNLRYTTDLGTPGSRKFNSTEKTILYYIEPLLRNSSIGPVYTGCEVMAFRSVKNRDDTGVDALCSYRNEATAPKLDRVKVYRELSSMTKDITTLGQYNLDNKSLYVNEYNEALLGPTLSPTTPQSPTAGHFTLNFTLTNLRYTTDLGTPGSRKFNSTQKTILYYIEPLLRNSSIGPVYTGCKVMAFRSVKNRDDTGVDALCSYRNEATAPKLDRVKVYRELSSMTKDITTLGQYNLDNKSLYVNEYNEALLGPTLSPTTPQSPTAGHFTLNFTLTNLRYTTDLGTPGSRKFNSTQKTILYYIEPLLRNSSIGPVYTGCEVMAFRSVKNRDDTGVDALCSYRNEATAPKLDRVKVYRELSSMTKDITTLGQYNLDNKSLYVNEYNEALLGPTLSPTTPQSPTAGHFTLNFTLTNLRYTTDLGTPGSRKFNSTQKTILYYIEPLLRNSSIGPVYTGCEVMAFRSVKNRDDTGVDALCSYRNEATAPKLDRVKVYRELSSMTKDITTLGQYNLDNKSLYVNEYNEALLGPTLSPTTPQSPTAGHFTLNFTLTNLRYTTDLGTPGSRKFNSTEKTILYYIEPLLRNSSIGPVYTGCKVMAFRSVKNRDDTGVDALCSYRNEATAPKLDRVKVYRELSSMTKDITTLGQYNLDNKSLYVNEYNEALLGPTLSLTTSQSPTAGHFTLNFTLTNLRYTTDLGTPGSRKFNSTEKTILYYIEPLLRNSSIGPVYTGCEVMAFRSANNKDTGINAVCSYKNNSTVATFDRVKLYHELSGMTKGITTLGPYTVEKNSLYVNGFRLSDIATTTEPPPTVTPETVGYLLNFKIINVNLTNPDPTSSAYQALQKDIADKINQLYKKSDLQGRFLYCSVTGLRIGSVVVDCHCYFKPAPNRSEETVLSAFQDGTRNASAQWLGGSYQLQGASVNVLEPVIKPVTQPPVSAVRETFRLNFTITNLFYSSELKQPNSNPHRLNKLMIEQALDNIFRNSSVKNYFAGCSVESFRPISGKTYTGINAICKFMLDSTSRAFQREEVYEEFKHLTNGVTQLGDSYTLDKDSLLVNDYSPLNTMAGEPGRSELPFWAIILICLSALLGLILLLLVCFLIAFCLRRKEGLYDVQQSIYGVYFPHLDMRKMH